MFLEQGRDTREVRRERKSRRGEALDGNVSGNRRDAATKYYRERAKGDEREKVAER